MGTTHTCIGQEGNAVAVARCLREDDVVVSNHRGHGHFLAHVGDIDGLMAEILGRDTGVCGGWGGSQHLSSQGKFYSNGIQGGTAPLAAGISLSEKIRGSQRICVIFLGDGTMGEGAVYEALNIAALWQLPVLFVVEDNQIAQTTPTKLALAGSITDRFAAFGIEAGELIFPSFNQLLEKAGEAVRDVREQSRPRALVIHTYRLSPHSKGDDTRPKEEVEAHRRFDPLQRALSDVPTEEVQRIEEKVQARLDEAYRKAAQASTPRLPIEREEGRRTSERFTPSANHPRSVRLLEDIAASGTMRDRLNQALHDIFEDDESTYLIGEDILDPYGGAFKVSEGLSTRFPDRVLTTPISEGGIVGLAGGMAIRGLRPVVEIMFGDFLGLCADQLINHVAKYAQMYGGQVTVPLVVRAPMGGRRGYGPTHSQTLDKHFLGIGGLDVVVPSPLHPAGNMLRAAVASSRPVLFLENKISYATRFENFGKSMVDEFYVHDSGSEDFPTLCLSLTEFVDESATILCYGGMLEVAMQAAKRLLLEREISARIICPGMLYPLEPGNILDLIPSGSSLLCLEEGSTSFGVGAELLSSVAEAAPERVARVSRVGARELPVPSSKALEDEVLPQVEDVVRSVVSLQ